VLGFGVQMCAMDFGHEVWYLRSHSVFLCIDCHAFINLDRMYHIDERQRCIQSACSLASFITGSCSVPTASASTVML